MKLNNFKRPSAARRRKIWFTGFLAVASAWSCLPARPFRPVEPIPSGIVDMHCHVNVPEFKTLTKGTPLESADELGMG